MENERVLRPRKKDATAKRPRRIPSSSPIRKQPSKKQKKDVTSELQNELLNLSLSPVEKCEEKEVLGAKNDEGNSSSSNEQISEEKLHFIESVSSEKGFTDSGSSWNPDEDAHKRVKILPYKLMSDSDDDAASSNENSTSNRKNVEKKIYLRNKENDVNRSVISQLASKFNLLHFFYYYSIKKFLVSLMNNNVSLNAFSRTTETGRRRSKSLDSSFKELKNNLTSNGPPAYSTSNLQDESKVDEFLASAIVGQVATQEKTRGKFGIRLRVGKRIYHFHRVSRKEGNEKFTWVCHAKKHNCLASIKTTLNSEKEHVIIESTGTHTENLLKKDVHEALKQAADKTSDINVQSLILEVNSKFSNEEAIKGLPQKGAQFRFVQRLKRRGEPAAVTDPIKFSTKGTFCESFTVFDFQHPKEETLKIVCFGTIENLKALSRSRGWVIDGTFKVASVFQQLYVIHGEVMPKQKDDKPTSNDEITEAIRRNSTAPFAFIFMTRKTKKSYMFLFRLLKNKLREVNEKFIGPIRVILDFEIAPRKALQKVSYQKKLNFFKFILIF